MYKKQILTLLTVFVAVFAFAQKEFTTQRTSRPVKVDGLLQEKDWQTCQWQGNWGQHEPENGKKPSQASEFAILFDNDFLYIAIRAYDSEPDKIERRMARRDSEEGDWLLVAIDSYNDKRTAFSFQVTAAGVKGDYMVTNDGDNWDSKWDPIWYVKTGIDSEGWVAEMKIPFNQLRFPTAQTQDWGIQIARYVFRNQELNLWDNFSQNESGFVQHFGRLKGLTGIKPRPQIDITPYALAKYETYAREHENPYRNKGWGLGGNAGVDGKIGITNDLTLDFSINPDFGQVEADPSEVNLSGFESYFQERRPFFIEGSNITNFGLSAFGGSFRRDNLFYSRRIGRSPHYYPEYDDDEYLDMPTNSRILGAFKLTGKTKKGWSIGIIESVTMEENAELATLIGENGTKHWNKEKIAVEPWTNYFISRLQKDLNDGNTQIGGMVTAVNRKLDEEHFDFIHKNAYTGGVDFAHFWNDRKYYLRANVGMSHVQGDKEAIYETQSAHRHYFQRPDADYLSIDEDATSLYGMSGEVAVGKNGSQGWRYLLSCTFRTPGMETNDVGFLRTADRIGELFWAGYRWAKPFGIFRNMNLGGAQWYGMNFGGESIYWGMEANWNMDFVNYWEFGSGLNFDGPSLSMSELRGGPALRESGGYSMWNSIESDGRKKLRFDFGMFNYWGREQQARIRNFWGGVSYRPIQSLRIKVNPRFSMDNRKLQYVGQIEEDINSTSLDTRYIFAEIDRKTFSLQFRIDYSITPDLSIQYYGQPFLATGLYSNFKKITNSRAKKFKDRYSPIPDAAMAYSIDNEEYTISEDGATYLMGMPDFNQKFFVSNLVVRWEYLPGSTLFAVWSQGRNDYVADGQFDFGNDIGELFSKYPNDIFMVKLSYRIPL